VADFFFFAVFLWQHAADAHFAYTAPFRIDDFDVKAIDIERLANGWDMAKVAQKEAADCLEPLALDGHVEAIADFVDVGRAAEHERAVAFLDDRLGFDVVLVTDLPKISSTRSSSVTRPAVPPYSSTTIAL
jgi:hypothetical protein